ncbi:C40 family peptidase [Apibacter adventoris]|uniref:Hydrolase Nlp/P60 n=1 Tax=Apibacter adventoris TaxID=1679466 RepID=A0A2S8A9Q3_9FLAO|nr:C40 family peptidase [Apibacter adventoris]PQL91292.1 hydrolase Nlp/P60 [Apibacter adventoris]
MKAFLKLFFLILITSLTTTSCVSNYIASNNNYKYPSTSKLLLANNSKGPNTTKTETKKLVTDNSLLNDNSVSENINFYAEKAFSKEAYKLITEAKTYLGTPYLYGGTTRRGIDCSSFVQQVFNASNISLPRTSALQSEVGVRVAKEELKKGDLIFFSHTPKSRVSHVGIVESVSPTGEIFFIHASSSQGVTITSLETEYWKKRFKRAMRILNAEEKQEEPNPLQDDIKLVKVTF